MIWKQLWLCISGGIWPLPGFVYVHRGSKDNRTRKGSQEASSWTSCWSKVSCEIRPGLRWDQQIETMLCTVRFGKPPRTENLSGQCAFLRAKWFFWYLLWLSLRWLPVVGTAFRLLQSHLSPAWFRPGPSASPGKSAAPAQISLGAPA